jgi:peroxiredoxin
MNRRNWLLGTIVAAPAAAGVAWQLHQEARAADAAADPATAALWRLRLPRPDGSELALSSLRGSPLVLNFWATWCAPCIEEMPDLDRFHRDHQSRGWKMLGLAIDNAAAVREFLARHSVSYPVAIAGFEGTDLSRQFGNAQGSLPFTAVLDRRGAVAQRRLGRTHLSDLQAWAKALDG